MGDISRHKARNIGISNFSPHQLQRLLLESDIKPAVHQFELHPYLQQVKWVEWHQEHDIKVTAYSPLGGTNPTYGPHHGSDKNDPPWLLENPSILQVAEKRGCTSAQVALAWGIGRDTIVIPKSSQVKHIDENFNAVNCELQKEDFDTIATVGRQYVKRYNNPSQQWGVHLFGGLDGLSV